MRMLIYNGRKKDDRILVVDILTSLLAMVFTFFPIRAVAKQYTMEENTGEAVSWGAVLEAMVMDNIDEAQEHAMATVNPLAGEERVM